ncbi:uncharacterized protein LOC114195057 [Vigna unguiculata]|uniref:uncharacterized protein LOC114195057 n=1 Tax=Vigna unguiculata TaxID=3917 RepID=UPI0010168DC9|nr:uncharacterized protein LOC114195057 [Vigna unguiculata]
MEIHIGPIIDEVQQYLDVRWICAPKALWKIFRFTIYQMNPVVERLQIHLPNRQQVRFYKHQNIKDVLNDDNNSKTMLTQFFALNQRDPQSRTFLYRKIPEHYCWNNRHKEWYPRRSNKKVIGRIYTVSPFEGDKFFLWVLLSHIRGPTSWEYLLSPNETYCYTFKKAAEKWGFLESDNNIHECLVEASTLQMPYALRRLFVAILLFCEPTDVRSLWNQFHTYMLEDYTSTNTFVNENFIPILLRDLNDLLIQHGKTIKDFDLPPLSYDALATTLVPRIIQEELSIQIPNEDVGNVHKLNHDQLITFNTILDVINCNQSQVFFVDGPGGTNKTFLYRTLIAHCRSNDQIILAIASSGIAATLLPGGRTAHSRFKIPINVEASSFCSISKQSDLVKLIKTTKAIIWDEAPMINRYVLEALNQTLKDILDSDAPFGGKVIILGGDFRQVLPVVQKGTKAQMIFACIINSHLWSNTKILHLQQNMRSLQDHNFVEYLMRIKNGIEPTQVDDMVKIPQQLAITWEGETSIQHLIHQTFPELQFHTCDASYMVERAILTPKNEDVEKLNDIIINLFPGEERNLLSFDEVEGDTYHLYQHEYSHTISPGGLPPHNLKVC